MISEGKVLCNSSLVGQSSAFTPVEWNSGGRAAIVVNALAYPPSPGLTLQVQGPSNLAGLGIPQWINIGSSFLADQVFSFDSVPGQYRLVNLGASSVVGVSAMMIRVPY